MMFRNIILGGDFTLNRWLFIGWVANKVGFMAASVGGSSVRTVALWRDQVTHQHEDLVKCLEYFASLILEKGVAYYHADLPRYKWEWLNPYSLNPNNRTLKSIWPENMNHPYMVLCEGLGQFPIGVVIKFDKFEDKKVTKVKVLLTENRFKLESQIKSFPNENRREAFEVTAHIDCDEGPIIEAMLKALGNKALIPEKPQKHWRS